MRRQGVNVDDIGAARRLAQLLVARHGVGPPIDVEVMLRERAVVTSVASQEQWDAFSIKRPNQRPEVYLREGVTPQRRRFSLAHELGHVVIPWHVGLSVLEPAADDDATKRGDDELHKAQEAEANEFASELLVPTAWLRETFDLRARDPETLLDRIERLATDADVSAIVAARAVVRLLVAPALLDLQHGSHAIQARSPTYQLRNNSRELPATLLAALEQRRATRQIGAYRFTLTVLNFAIPTEPADDADPDAILRTMLDDRGTEHQAMARRINGVCGAANNTLQGDDFESSYAVLYQCLQRNLTGQPIVNDRRFVDYVRAKALTLARRKTPATR